MEYTTETVEIEEICEDGIPVKKFKQIVKGYDQRYITDWKNDPNYKNWVEKVKKDDETTTTATVTTYQFETGETAECIELSENEPKNHIEVKTIKKTNATNTGVPARNNRSGKRQIRVMDPNLPSFVCTEHNENISLDCRYCRIASGFKKKNTQRHVQNDEISSTGKVTVAIPKRDPSIVPMKTVDETVEVNRETFSTNSSRVNSITVAAQKILQPGIPNHNIQKTSGAGSKEEIFGHYVASELKRIKNKKTYEEVKWKILQTLQSAAEKEAEDQDKSASE